MSSENVEVARRMAERMALDDWVAAMKDEAGVRAAAVGLLPFVDPEFEVEMVGPEYLRGGPTYRGLDGYIEAWRDWLQPYESYRAELEDFVGSGDKVVLLVRQIGRTEVGGVPIEQHGAVVFTFESGKVTRLEFHLDRERAMKAAGLAE